MESGHEKEHNSGTISLVLFLGIGWVILASLFVFGAMTYKEIKVDMQFLLITGLLMFLGIAFVSWGIRQSRILKRIESQ